MGTNTTGRPDSKPVGRMLRRSGTLTLVPLIAGAVVGIHPAWFGLSTTPYVLHVISFRGLMAIGFALLGAAAACTLLFDRAARSRTPGSGRPWRRRTAALVLVGAALVQFAILGQRGWAAAPIPGRADLVVVSSNTLDGAATPADIAELVSAELGDAEAAMVSLPETNHALAQQVADSLARRGQLFQVFSTSEGTSRFGTTSLLIDTRLGAYRQLPAPKMLLGAVLAEPVDGKGPVLVAVHPGAPTPDVGYPQWRAYVDSAVGLSRDHPNSVVAGDFNTTIDHQMLRNLEPSFDAATGAGRAAEGTWPSDFPAALSAPIDHVLLHGDFTVLGTRTQRLGGSDHRALIARLRLVRQ